MLGPPSVEYAPEHKTPIVHREKFIQLKHAFKHKGKKQTIQLNLGVAHTNVV